MPHDTSCVRAKQEVRDLGPVGRHDHQISPKILYLAQYLLVHRTLGHSVVRLHIVGDILLDECAQLSLCAVLPPPQ